MAHHRIACIALACAAAQPAVAQTAPSPITGPGSDAPPLPPPGEGSDWVIDIGVGTFYAPAFLGSDDYQLFAAPVVSVRYKDTAISTSW